MPNVFISYSHSDLSTAKKLSHFLADQGIAVWRDQESLYGGELWPKTIGDAIFSSDTLLLVWSKHAESSKHVELEWCVAICTERSVIVCLLDDTPLPATLRAKHSIDSKNLQDAFSQILRSLQGEPPTNIRKYDAELIRRLNEIAATNPDGLLSFAKITKAPCPLCGSLIKIHDTDWQCPACKTVNRNWMIMKNCEWCRFAPHFLTCPQCKDDFNLWLLMGGYTDDAGRPIPMETGRRKSRSWIHHHRVGDLVTNTIAKPDKKATTFLTDKFGDLLKKFEFPFPQKIACFMTHTIVVSPDDRLWMHSWLFARPSPDEKEHPQGQLAMMYPAKTKNSDRDFEKIDCVVNEYFW